MSKLVLPERARRDDVLHGHMTVQDNLDRVLDSLNALDAKLKRGSATIVPPATTVLAVHNLGSPSYGAVVTPTADVGAGLRWWISNKTATQFQINLSAAPAGNVPFEWVVKGD